MAMVYLESIDGLDELWPLINCFVLFKEKNREKVQGKRRKERKRK